ncbi:MAG: MFS transporter, partial [Pseudomonadota bacterium]
PLGALALWLLLAKVPADRGDTSHPLDYTGAVLTTAALVALALGLTLLGGAGAGLDVYTTPLGGAWGVLALAALLTAVALWVEHRKADPMIELSLFRSPAFAGANASTLLIYTALGATLFFLPMLLVVGWGLSEAYAGGIFLPFSLLIAGLSPLVGKYGDANGPRLPLTLGPLFTALGLFWMGWSAFGQNYWWGVVPAVLLMGTGMGITVSPLSTAVMQSVEDRQTGQASGINNMVARMANLVAIAGFGALVSVLFARFVEGSELPAELASLLVDAGFGERLTGALYQVAVVDVQAQAMNGAFAWTCFATAGLCIVAAAIGWLTQKS